jgi:hypothetical protein
VPIHAFSRIATVFLGVWRRRTLASVPRSRCDAVDPTIVFAGLANRLARAPICQGNLPSINLQEPTAGVGASWMLQSLRLAVPLLPATCSSACNQKVCVANLHDGLQRVALLCARGERPRVRGQALIDSSHFSCDGKPSSQSDDLRRTQRTRRAPGW